jgi:hypothetical protein
MLYEKEIKMFHRRYFFRVTNEMASPSTPFPQDLPFMRNIGMLSAFIELLIFLIIFPFAARRKRTSLIGTVPQ